MHTGLGVTLPCDHMLVQATLDAAARIGVPEMHSEGARQQGRGGRLPLWPGSTVAPVFVRGVVASDDAFCCEPSIIARCRQHFGSVCEEMEAGAEAVVCKRFSVPFCAIKEISNNELTLEGQNQPLLETELGKRAAALALALVVQLKGRQ